MIYLFIGFLISAFIWYITKSRDEMRLIQEESGIDDMQMYMILFMIVLAWPAFIVFCIYTSQK